MAIVAKASGNENFELTPAGQYAALCYKIIDCGTQTKDGQYGLKTARRVKIAWELHGDNQLGEGRAVMKDGRPFIQQKEFTLSLHEKATLRAFLESWRGRQFTEQELEYFDVSKLMGVPCMLTIQHNKKGENNYANITNITPLLKSIPRPEMINQPVLFEMEPWNQQAFDGLSDGLKEYIRGSEEYKAMHDRDKHEPSDTYDQRTPPTDAYLEDIPF